MNALADAWDAGTKAFGPALGMEGMTGEALRAMNAQVCGMEDGIVSLTVDGSTITAVNAEGEGLPARLRIHEPVCPRVRWDRLRDTAFSGVVKRQNRRPDLHRAVDSIAAPRPCVNFGTGH